MMTDESPQDWADRIGKRVSTVVIALLAALFAVGYLVPIFFG
jgi:hypothetical protein